MNDTSTIEQTQQNASWAPLKGAAAFWQTADEGAAPSLPSGVLTLGQQLKTDQKQSAIAKIDAAWPDASAELVKRYTAQAERKRKIARQEAARACLNLGLEVEPESIALAYAKTIQKRNEKPTATAGEWHAKRAQRLAKQPSEVANTCGQKAIVVECGCQRLAVPDGCGRPQFCQACAARKRSRLVSKVKRAVHAANSAGEYLGGRRGPGRRLEWYLVTFTIRDRGDPERDRRDLAAAFNRWRTWLYNKTCDALPYCLAWEVTPGAEGSGHVHAHALMRLPWLHFETAAAAWVHATKGLAEANGLDFGRRDANGKPRRAPTVHEAARYVAKYIAKGSSKDCDAQLLARWYCAQYQKRSYSASQGFFAAKSGGCACQECGVFWQFAGIIEAPEPLKTGDFATVARQFFAASG